MCFPIRNMKHTIQMPQMFGITLYSSIFLQKEILISSVIASIFALEIFSQIDVDVIIRQWQMMSQNRKIRSYQL